MGSEGEAVAAPDPSMVVAATAAATAATEKAPTIVFQRRPEGFAVRSGRTERRRLISDSIQKRSGWFQGQPRLVSKLHKSTIQT
ncbi:hypothetical protein JCM9957A_25480 [Kineosporia succinea]